MADAPCGVVHVLPRYFKSRKAQVAVLREAIPDANASIQVVFRLLLQPFIRSWTPLVVQNHWPPGDAAGDFTVKQNMLPYGMLNKGLVRCCRPVPSAGEWWFFFAEELV